MDKKEWDALERVVQDQLASKFGITRSGENNEIVTAEALANIPEPKEEPKKDEETKKETRKAPVKKTPKRSNRGRTIFKRK